MKNLVWVIALAVLCTTSFSTFADKGSGGGGVLEQRWAFEAHNLLKFLENNPKVMPQVNRTQLRQNVWDVYLDREAHVFVELNGKRTEKEARNEVSKNRKYIYISETKMPTVFANGPSESWPLILHEYSSFMNLEFNTYNTSQGLKAHIKKTSFVDQRSVILKLNPDPKIQKLRDKFRYISQMGPGDTSQAVSEISKVIEKLIDELHLGEVSHRVETWLNENYQEVKVGEVQEDTLYTEALMVVGPKNSAIPLSMEKIHRHKYDITEMILTNPDEVVGFDEKQKKDLIRLQQHLRAYMESQVTDLIFLKIAVLHLFELLKGWGRLPLHFSSFTQLHNLVQPALVVQFWGRQTINICKTENFIKKKKSMSQSVDVSILPYLTIFHIIPIERRSETNTSLPYTKRLCKTNFNKVRVSQSEIRSIDLNNLDTNILKVMEEAYEILILNTTERAESSMPINWNY